MDIFSPASVDQWTGWNRNWFVVCAGVYLAAGMVGVWYALTGRSSARIILSILCLVLFVGLAYHAPYTIDDSYIFFRYADNVAHGLGPAYNPGERCEGFTSPAWLAMLAGGAVIGFDPLVLAKVLGAILAFGTVLTIHRTIRRFASTPLEEFVALYLLVVSQFVVSWFCCGMDVALFLFWLALMADLFTNARASAALCWLMTAVGVWIRPEAAVVIAAAWVGRLWGDRSRQSGRSTALRAIGVFALVAAPFVVRYFVFQDWLPTTFYAKSDRTLRNGVGFLFGAVHAYGPLICLPAVIGLWSLRRTHPWILGVCVLFGAWFVAVGGDVLTQRFALFWLPFLWIGLTTALRLARERFAGGAGRIAIALVLVAASQELHRMYQVTRAPIGSEGYLYVATSGIGTMETDARIGRYIASNGDAQDLIVTDNIGAVGYYSHARIRDVNGLVDPEMARLIWRDRKDSMLTRVRETEAEWIICYPGLDSAGVEYQLVNVGLMAPWINEQYDHAATWKSRTGYTRVLMRRKNGPDIPSNAP